MALNARSEVVFDTPPKCTGVPSNANDLVNKDYVDGEVSAAITTAVNEAITAIEDKPTEGSSTPATPTALTDSNGTYTASCPTLTNNTTISVDGHTHTSLKNIYGVTVFPPAIGGTEGYMLSQEAVAPSYSPSATYAIGDVCSYQGELWERKNASGGGVAPSTQGMLWSKTTMISMLGGGGAIKKTATVNPGNGTVDMSGGAEVVIDQSTYFLGTVGLIFSNISGSGMLSVEVHLVFSSAGTRSSFKVSAGSGSQEVTWIRGSLSDLSTAGTHIVHLRSFTTGSAIYAEYIGSY